MAQEPTTYGAVLDDMAEMLREIGDQSPQQAFATLGQLLDARSPSRLQVHLGEARRLTVLALVRAEADRTGMLGAQHRVAQQLGVDDIVVSRFVNAQR